jgi:hypothetical protein
MLYISEDEASDEDFSPTPAKRRKRSSPRGHHPHPPHPPHPDGNGDTDSSPSHPAGQPLMGDFLATILTDIPEVDICSLSSLSTNSPSTRLAKTLTTCTFVYVHVHVHVHVHAYALIYNGFRSNEC